MMKTTLWRNFQVGRLSSSKSGRQKTEMLPQYYRGEDALTKTDFSVKVKTRFNRTFLLRASMSHCWIQIILLAKRMNKLK